MNLNPLSMLPFFGTDAADKVADLTDEQVAAEEKAARIKLHREQVRNGPVRWNRPTNGQIRRAEQRARNADQKKAYRNEVRSYFEQQRLAATLRGQLQTAGLLPFIGNRPAPSLEQQVVSTAWILTRYGVEDVEDGEGTGMISFRQEDIIKGLRNAAQFYSRVTGYPVTVPDDFAPAVLIAEARA